VLRSVTILVCFVGLGQAGPARAGPAAGWSRPPEEERFDNTKFRSELLRRDLGELLEYYKRTRPPVPRGPDAELLRREELLSRYRDTSLRMSERVATLDQAMAILETLIQQRPEPPRAWQWKLQLGKDLLFRRAEPYYNNVLYRGWTSADAATLEQIATRAEDTFVELADEIAAFLARVDDMSLAEFRRVERTGVLKVADTVKPQAEYFLQWSRFYRVLACEQDRRKSQRRLRDIIQFVEQESDYTNAPHSETGVQAQSLLLIGMCRRLVGDWQQAGERLVQARDLVSSLPAEEGGPVRWVFVLAQLELAKLARDAGHFALAHQVVAAMEEWRLQEMPDNFALALALALLDGDASRREAEQAEKENQPARAEELRMASRRPLLTLLRSDPAHQGDVFRAFADLVDAQADPRNMDPFEQNAVMAALLGKVAGLRAGQESASADQALGGRIREHLQRVLDVGRYALADTSALGRELRPFALFNVAVAHYQLGRPDSAVERLVELVREHPDFSRSATALDYAVRIAADYYAQDTTKSDRRRLETFVRALSALEAAPGESEPADYWRYYLADALGRLGRLQESADMFHRVPPESENYYSATYLETVKRWEIYQHLRDQDTDADTLRRRLEEVIAAAERCRQALAPALGNTAGRADAADLRAYQGGALLLSAEAYVQPVLDQPARALEILEGFEQRFAGQAELMGRAWHVHIIAHERLGQLAEAGRLVDLYLQREPRAAGPVMDQLLRSMTREVRRLRQADRPYDAAATQALNLAQKLYAWARDHPELLGEVSPDSFRIRLAGAHLLAGDYARALEISSALLQGEARRRPEGGGRNLEALQCQAEALYQLGRYAEAQPVFYELWALQPEGSDDWWQALLRSLQCHTEMNSPPAGIVAEIRRLRHTRPAMGGPVLQAEFERLEQINTQRGATSAGGSRP